MNINIAKPDAAFLSATMDELEEERERRRGSESRERKRDEKKAVL